MLTNGAQEQQEAKLAHLGLLEHLGPVLTAEGIGVAKPNPRAFCLVCAHWALPPEQVLYVGDDYVVDVLAARAAGLQAVYLDRVGAGPMREHNRMTTLAELLAYVTGSTTNTDRLNRPGLSGGRVLAWSSSFGNQMLHQSRHHL
jgi:putative hydrolase of the HAD superfamily